MSTFYNLLKEKVEKPNIKDEIAIIGVLHSDKNINYFSMSYKGLFDLVNEYIAKFKNPDYVSQPTNGKRKYIVVDNSINSIAAIIALLEIGAIPFIIDSKNILEMPSDKLPCVSYGNLIGSKKNEDDIMSRELWNTGLLNKKMDGEDKEGSKLIICSSGTESTAHAKLIREEELINLSNQYGENRGTFYSYVSCAHISGVLTNIVNLLVNDNKILLAQGFDLEDIYFIRNYSKLLKRNLKQKYIEKRYFLSTANPELIDLVIFRRNSVCDAYIDGDELVVKEISSKYKEFSWNSRTENDYLNGKMSTPDSIMLPRDILSYISKINPRGINLSNVKHIYLTGGMNSYEVIKILREKFPSIKKDVFINLYGSTEANGVMCCCYEKDFKTCYINVADYEFGRITYTYDHRHYYEIVNGIVSKIPRPKDVFGYMPYLTASSKYEPNITVENNLNIMYKGDKTGDIGIYIDNQLYVLGRKSELIKLNGRNYIINSLEAYFSKKLGAEILIIADGDKGIQPYIKYDKIIDVNSIMAKYYELIKLSRTINAFHVAPPIIIDDYVIEKSKISGKQPRSFLKFIAEEANEQHLAIAGTSRAVARNSGRLLGSLTNYDCEVLDDGRCIVNLYREPVMISNEIINCFYRPSVINKNLICFSPKPEIIFANIVHILKALSKPDQNFENIKKELLDYIINNIDNVSEYLIDGNKSFDGAKGVDDIFKVLEQNILFDFYERFLNEIKYRIAHNLYNSPNLQQNEVIIVGLETAINSLKELKTKHLTSKL